MRASTRRARPPESAPTRPPPGCSRRWRPPRTWPARCSSTRCWAACCSGRLRRSARMAPRSLASKGPRWCSSQPPAAKGSAPAGLSCRACWLRLKRAAPPNSRPANTPARRRASSRSSSRSGASWWRRSPSAARPSVCWPWDASGMSHSIPRRSNPQRKTEEAKALADELLTVARLEGRALTARSDRFALHDVVREAVTRARPRAELVKGAIKTEAGADLAVKADRAMVGKILDNLLNNALAYSDHPPTVSIAIHREGEWVGVSVSDDGIGVSALDQGRIFARFARGTDQRVLEKPGTGLGLYLSRGLAERMGGSLTLASSRPGKGSTFVLRLPPG